MQSALRWATRQLQAAGSESPRTDAELLLGAVTGLSRTAFFTRPEQELSAPQRESFELMVMRRCDGEPVAYLTGQRAFWTLELFTRPDTLIPRPDTETLVEAVLARTLPGPLDVVDLGTGTGAIALALAAERPAWRVTGIDRVAEAVSLARKNAQHNALEQVEFRQGSWCDDLADHSVDVLVSNPPYVRADDPHLQQGDVRFEPASALVAGADGLTDLRHIVKAAGRVLRAGGWLFLEHGHDQADDVALLLIDAGFSAVETVPDLARQPRVTLGRLPVSIR